MNILFVKNIASMQSLTTRYLNTMQNVNAICLVNHKHIYNPLMSGTICINRHTSKKKIFKFIFNKLHFHFTYIKYLLWADAVSFCWDSEYKEIDLKILKFFKKKIFIEWVGSDIRDPEILKKINPFYAEVLYDGYEYLKLESSNFKVEVQQKFAKYDAVPIIIPEMSLYLSKQLFKKYYTMPYRLDCDAYNPIFPDIKKEKITIVHSPTAKVGKGSNYIIPILKELETEFNVEYKLMHNVSREQNLQEVAKCDIFIDQIVVGSYGMASCEAMALGKPVIAYIMPEVFAAGLPLNCPIINANPQNLKEVLVSLITKPSKLEEIGKLSRAFAETYHNVELLSTQLFEIYKN